MHFYAFVVVKLSFSKNSFRNIIRLANSLVAYQDRRSFDTDRHDPGPKHTQDESLIRRSAIYYTYHGHKQTQSNIQYQPPRG